MSQEHYFTAEPASPDERRTRTVHLAGQDVAVETAGGVFSPDHLDGGTDVLLRHVPAPPRDGALLDLGCGWGPITLTLALRSPGAEVWGVDVNERALDLTRRNAAALGLGGVHAVRPEDVPDDVRFAAIWSNPPIRVGKETLHAMLRQWLHRLVPGGEAYLVVAKNLGSDSLLRWLAAELDGAATVDRVATDRGFRVLRVVAR
ncbi:class I SAM-dependent methyltransferase [Cellulomonas triticagri]|uniref:Class I SAM-dependent methyltransferase n=1 Tax=Cellulomonas triticagri TaxID=2483352 RepID=A0A3M2J660_9CELL|nr:methyltransferase [Cellulomonas triticagri]RMI08909.1 class I SAM-dependent methyltransferase [Cellulomonas triticagri]